MERSEVLDLAIDHSWDAITVARCSLASKWSQRRCKAHVQQHLPTLLATAHADASQEYRTHGSCRRDMHRRSIEWLYRTAGRAVVGSVGTATALLCCVNQMPWGLSDVLVPMAVEYGVQLTAEAVVTASKARTELFVWVNTFFPLTPSSFLSFVDVRQATPGTRSLPAAVQSILLWDMGKLERSLPQVTPQQMQDLLYIAVNHNGFGVPTLLKHDKQHTHVLYGDISDSGLADSRTQLIEHLSITSIVKKHPEVMTELAATPAAQNLSPAAVLQLLYLALDNEAEEETLMSLDKAVAPLLAAVLEVPSARAVDAAKLGNLMHFALKKQRPGTVAILSTLPQAQQLPSKQLCELLMMAGARAGQEQRCTEFQWEQKQSDRQLVQRLAVLDGGRHLAPGDAFKLLESALEHLWGPNMSMDDVLEDLDDMKLGSQLTGSELLQLMVLSTKDGYSDCSALAGVEPAVDLINNEEGYVEFLLAAMGNRVDGDVVQYAAEQVPLTQQLSLNSVLKLLKEGGLRPFLVKVPAIQQISVDAAGQLLLQAAYEGCLHDVAELLAVPAATQLSTALLQEILSAILEFIGSRRCTSNLFDLEVIPRILALPAAAELSAGAVAELLLLAIDRLELEQELEQERNADWHRQNSCWRPALLDIAKQLLEHPATAQLSEASAAQLVQAAVRNQAAALLEHVCALPAMQHVTEGTVVQLVQAAIVANTAELSRPIFALPAIQHLSEKSGVQLVQAAVAAKAAELSRRVLELPALQHMSEKSAVQLLQSAIAATDAEVLEQVCTLPAVQRISEDAARQLYQAALDKADIVFLWALEEQLPQVAAVAATIEPTGEQLQKQMLQAVNSEYLDTLCDLLKHPAAAQVSPDGMQQVLQGLLQLIVRYRQIDDGEVELGPEGDGGPVWLSIRSQAAQAISAAAAAQLMLYCVKQQSPAGLKLVSLLPGVAQLDTRNCESLLQQSLQVVASSRHSLRSFGVLRSLLQLPAVQKLPAEAVGRLLLSGIDSASLQLATMQLLYQQLPATQHLSCNDARALLFAAFEQKNKATFTYLRGLPAAPDDDEVQAWCCILGLRPA